MLDNLGIVISAVAMLIVIIRAVQMDRTIPWFRDEKSGPDSSGLRLTPAARVREEPKKDPIPEKPQTGWRRK